MDLFKDAIYEDLDEISQLVEPFEFELNNELSKMDEEIILDAEFFRAMVNINSGRESSYESLRKIVERHANKLGLKLLVKQNKQDYNFCNKFFKIKHEEGMSYNAKTGELIGEAKVIKTKVAYEDKEIEDILVKYMKDEFNNKLGRPSAVSKPRLNEICDLFGAYEALKDRSARGKVNLLYKKYIELINDRKLNIRDVELFKRFIDWNIKYVVNGSLPSMSNITKVKIMMRNELPIYSIKEEQV